MLVIGHRGASAAAPENTVEAFELAAAMGADGVELDVRLAPDGRLVVKHDPLPTDAERLAGYPDLATVLAACGDMLVNVEIKNSVGDHDRDDSMAVVAMTIAEMRLLGPLDRWILSSFDWDTIERCRAEAPDIASAYLVMEATDATIARVAEHGHAAVHPHADAVTAATVDRCHEAGIALNTWTCNDPARIRQLDDIGVDGVVTDVPDIALSALGRRVAPPTPGWGRPA